MSQNKLVEWIYVIYNNKREWKVEYVTVWETTTEIRNKEKRKKNPQ